MKVKSNFFAFIWHAFWLALAETFAEKNIVLPGLILFAGGSQFDVGILTSIMIGVPLFSQFLFALFLTSKKYKKKFLLLGIYIRVASFIGVAVSIFYYDTLLSNLIIYVVFFWMFLFTVSGAFAGISYSDIVGKSFDSSERKKFFVIRQSLSGFGILISAILVNILISTIEYPENYQTAFFTAGVLLFIGSIGLFKLNEKPSDISERRERVFELFQKAAGHIRNDSNLKAIVLIANLIGFSYVLIPFYPGFLNKFYEIDQSTIGTILIVQITGIIFSNLIWNRILKITAFKGLLKIVIFLISILPILLLAIGQFEDKNLFFILFFLSGSAISAYKIVQEGIIIEISNEQNRALYAGIFGTLNIVIAIFPLLLGMMIEYFGYNFILIILPAITLSSYLLLNKLECPTS